MSLTLEDTPLLYHGRINRPAFVISVFTLFGVCWLTAFIRFYVRFAVQRSISIDDGFLIFGLCCMTAAIGLNYTFLNETYIVGSYILGQASLAYLPGFLDVAFESQKLVTVVLMLSWMAICCVKLSFLFLFHKLINRLRYAIIYWWIVLIFVIATTGYGLAVYVLVCPYFYSLEALQCITGTGLRRSLDYAISQIILDIVGDILILTIPVYLIWKIQIGLKQKFWLACSLCLTIIMIVVTIIRVSGILTSAGQLDSLWEDYWNIISAEVGLILTSATAFRTLYMAKATRQPYKHISTTSSRISSMIQSSKHFFIKAIHPKTWFTASDNSTSKLQGFSTDSDDNKFSHYRDPLELGTLPRAHMTGIRTVFKGVGRSHHLSSTTHMMQSHLDEEEREAFENAGHSRLTSSWVPGD